uniref:CYTH domain-containing protein n=1 Tax=Plectus sambesii TaxID=2011161 RepID=A0A914UZK6_9BILA
MPRNVEIKAKVADAEQLEQLAMALTESYGDIMSQTDTFFIVPHGRLKLRVLGERQEGQQEGQLIFYHRPDVSGPKLSEFQTTFVDDAASLLLTLSLALGVLGVVKKRRKLFMHGQTRIHVDTVEELGSYMELEVMLTDDQTLEDGQKIAEEVMEKLQIKTSDLVTGAYLDSLIHKAAA